MILKVSSSCVKTVYYSLNHVIGNSSLQINFCNTSVLTEVECALTISTLWEERVIFIKFMLVTIFFVELTYAVLVLL